MSATDFFGEPIRPTRSAREVWWLLECGHYGKAQLRGRETTANCAVCESPRRVVRKEASA